MRQRTDEPKPEKEGGEEGGKEFDGGGAEEEPKPSLCTRDRLWHRDTYTAAIQAVVGAQWALGMRGNAQVEALQGAVFDRYLDGATCEQAENWYRARAFEYVDANKQTSKRRTGEEQHGPCWPGHFKDWLFQYSGRSFPHAKPRGPVAQKPTLPAHTYLPDEVTHAAADGLLAALDKAPLAPPPPDAKRHKVYRRAPPLRPEYHPLAPPTFVVPPEPEK